MPVIPFIPEHIELIDLHPVMEHQKDKLLVPGYAEMLLDAGPAYTLTRDGEVVACAGVAREGLSRWFVWCLMSRNSGPHMLPLVREARKFFEIFEARRLECHVRRDFAPGARLMQLLGFTCETPNGMAAFGDDGHDYDLYAKVKPWIQ
jgi:hypothetical protein